MERLLQQLPCDPKQMNPLSLAFVGDAVFELFVREKLVCAGNCPVKTLHRRAVEQVGCQAQSAAGQRLFDSFTPEEQDIYRRGRNAHVNHVPKNAEPADYHAATALEALVGYLYLKGDLSRLQALFALLFAEGKDAADG